MPPNGAGLQGAFGVTLVVTGLLIGWRLSATRAHNEQAHGLEHSPQEVQHRRGWEVAHRRETVNVLDVLTYGNRTFMQSLDGLAERNWHAGGVCGVWSVKDIVAHLASHELLLLEVLDTFLGAEPGAYMLGFGQPGVSFNDVQVDERRHLSVREVLAEYEEAHEGVVERAARIPSETSRQVGTMPWYGPEYALDDLIAYGNYGHKREHSAQINVYRDSLSG
jgi:hypothetical protein